MPLRAAKVLIVLALTLSLGAHWALLQSFAWVSMVITYSQEATLADALEKTFDGEHPCKICNLVREGKQAEKKQDVIKVEADKKFVSQSSPVKLFAPSAFTLVPLFTESSLARCESPLLPPPRRPLFC